jgi:DNA-directed RNA polymerase subunit RPC12/RpoP
MRYVVNTCRKCNGQFEFEAKEAGREWSCPHCNAPVFLIDKRKEKIRDWLSRLILLAVLGALVIYLPVFAMVPVIGSGIGFVLIVIVGLPLAILFKPSRKYVGGAIFVWTPLSLLGYIIICFKIVFDLWGKGYAVVGVALGGLPIIPMAFIAALCNGLWQVAIGLVLYAVIVNLSFMGGAALVSWGDDDRILERVRTRKKDIHGDPRN